MEAQHSTGTRKRLLAWWPITTYIGNLIALVLVAIIASLAVAWLGHGHGEKTIPETAGALTHTHQNAFNAGGRSGANIGPGQTVDVSCRILGERVPDGNRWWYRISDNPWRDRYYASADAFYNNPHAVGPVKGTPFVDPSVPTCDHQ